MLQNEAFLLVLRLFPEAKYRLVYFIQVLFSSLIIDIHFKNHFQLLQFTELWPPDQSYAKKNVRKELLELYGPQIPKEVLELQEWSSDCKTLVEVEYLNLQTDLSLISSTIEILCASVTQKYCL